MMRVEIVELAMMVIPCLDKMSKLDALSGSAARYLCRLQSRRECPDLFPPRYPGLQIQFISSSWTSIRKGEETASSQIPVLRHREWPLDSSTSLVVGAYSSGSSQQTS
jgi:hypothetical protein